MPAGPNLDPKIEAIAAEGLEAIRRREHQAAIDRAIAEERAEQAKVYQLGFWPEDERAMPGDFIACALFTASKATSYVTRCELASINGLTVIFTGKRLTQVHADVWMGIMHIARERCEGEVIRFRDRELLELIGRHTHQHQREQLKDWISQLKATDLLIEDESSKKRFGGSLLPWHEESDAEGHTLFVVTIRREVARMLSADRFACIDWHLRGKLKNKRLALWLQVYFQRFKRPVSVKQLHALSGSGAELKEFRRKLAQALADLHAAGGHAAAMDLPTDIVRATARAVPVRVRSSSDAQTVLPFVRKA